MKQAVFPPRKKLSLLIRDCCPARMHFFFFHPDSNDIISPGTKVTIYSLVHTEKEKKTLCKETTPFDFLFFFFFLMTTIVCFIRTYK